MGGGAMATEDCRPVFRRVRFLRNTAHTGGALAIGATAHARVEDCRAEENSALGIGGAFQVHDGGELVLRRCAVQRNTGGEGGALGVGGGRIEAETCTLLANRGGFGGAISVISGTGVLRGCLVRGNEADYWGGAVNSTSGTVRLEATWADSNRAWLGGGAIYAYDSTVEAENSLITGNDAGPALDGPGGAVSSRVSSVVLTGCTLAANRGLPGAGLWLDYDSNASLERCLLASGRGGAAIEGEPGAFADAGCCDLWENEGGDWTGLVAGQDAAGGNLWADPLFCEAQASETPWSIASGSPCAPPHSGTCGLIGAGAVACVLASTPGDAAPTEPGSGSLVLTLAPNPSAGEIRIGIRLSGAAGRDVALTVHDAAGRLVRRFSCRLGNSGTAAAEWDGRDAAGHRAPRGTYWIRATADAGPAEGGGPRVGARVVRR